MRLDDLRPTENVDDRRGQGGGFGGSGIGGRHIVMGGGGLGLVAFIVIALLANGGDVGGLLNQMTSDQGGLPYGPGQTQSQPASQEDQAAYEFSRKIIGSTEMGGRRFLPSAASNIRPRLSRRSRNTRRPDAAKDRR